MNEASGNGSAITHMSFGHRFSLFWEKERKSFAIEGAKVICNRRSESHLQIGVVTPVLQNECGSAPPKFAPLCPEPPTPVIAPYHADNSLSQLIWVLFLL